MSTLGRWGVLAGLGTIGINTLSLYRGIQMYPARRNGRRTMRSEMQHGIADAIRAARTTRGAQSWRVRDVVSGKDEPCATLEIVIDEKIANGASDADVMAIPYTLVRETRAKLQANRTHATDIALAYEQEEAQQGRAGAAQMRVLGRAGRCATSLRAAWSELCGHREKLEHAIEATEMQMLTVDRETANRAGLRQTSLNRLKSP